MKRILTFTVAVVAMFSAASCQKESFAPNATERTDGTVRIVTAQFSSGTDTKTTLGEDDKPLWAVGDKIRILDDATYQDVILKEGSQAPTAAGEGIISDGKIVMAIPAAMDGCLYAIYPATATKMEKCENDSIIFTVPSVQDGSFGGAHISVAKSVSEDLTAKDKLVFSNATAVIEMTVAENVIGTKIESENDYMIAGELTAFFGADGKLSGLNTDALSSKIVSISGTSVPADNKFYVSVAPGNPSSGVTFTCNTLTHSADTTVESRSDSLMINRIYAIDLSGMTIDNVFDLTGQKGMANGHEYVIINVGTSAAPVYQKWATMNIGATTVDGDPGTSFGDYFAWGAVQKQYSEVNYTAPENAFTFLPDNPDEARYTGEWDAAKGFDVCNTPFYDNYECKKYFYGETDTLKVLEPSDDAAAVLWGGAWRMPTGGDGGDFYKLKEAMYWKIEDNQGCYVFVPKVPADKGKCSDEDPSVETYDNSEALLFFPAAGRGGSLKLEDTGRYCYYWGSVPQIEGSKANSNALSLRIKTSKGVAPSNGESRHYGMPIRPILGDAVPVPAPTSDVPEGAITGVFTVADPDGTPDSGDEKRVYFSKGNLYCDTTVASPTVVTWHFEEAQYHFRNISSAESDSALVGTAVKTPANTVGRFYWSKSEKFVYAEKCEDDDRGDSDIFFTNAAADTSNPNFNVDGQTGWRTLSKDEWTYLLQTRVVKGTSGEPLGNTCSLVTLPSPAVSGLVIYPDGYAGELVTDEIPDGCVFLPAGGVWDEDDVYDTGEIGIYWTSVTEDEADAYMWCFVPSENVVSFDKQQRTQYGCSVRLVMDVTADAE